MKANLVEIYYLADEFCKEFDKMLKNRQIDDNSGKKRRNKPAKLNNAEVITILILFHLGGFRNLKHFYIHYVQKHLKQDFFFSWRCWYLDMKEV